MAEDEQKVFIVTATKTLTATFEVDADDEDDASFLVENAVGFDYEVTCSDAIKLDQDDWDVSDVKVKT